MDTWNRLTAVRGEQGWGTGWKDVKGLAKEHIYIYIYIYDILIQITEW